MTKADEGVEVLTIIGQVIVLSVGFALVFSWDADIQPRLLALIILILLILIYPMTDRLNNKAQEQFIELQKAHGLTQMLMMELRERMPEISEDEHMSQEDKIIKAQGIADKYETLRLEFEESFKKQTEHTRSMTGADQTDFLATALGMAFYFSGLIGGSALIGWLISLPF